MNVTAVFVMDMFSIVIVGMTVTMIMSATAALGVHVLHA